MGFCKRGFKASLLTGSICNSALVYAFVFISSQLFKPISEIGLAFAISNGKSTEWNIELVELRVYTINSSITSFRERSTVSIHSRTISSTLYFYTKTTSRAIPISYHLNPNTPHPNTSTLSSLPPPLVETFDSSLPILTHIEPSPLPRSHPLRHPKVPKRQQWNW